jgi:hypothetical protein
MLGYTRPITQGATHYHTHAVNPVWNSGLVETTSIESHVFYRFPNRSERAHYQEALARRRGALGSRRGAAADELIPEADEAALQTIEGAVTEDAPATPAPAAAATGDAAEGEVAT